VGALLLEYQRASSVLLKILLILTNTLSALVWCMVSALVCYMTLPVSIKRLCVRLASMSSITGTHSHL